MVTVKNETVLVTGGSGYVALFCIIKLLREGYKVRTTVRKLSRKDEIIRLIRNSGLAVGDDEIEFVEADLLSDNGWGDAVKGCKYILHVASPFPAVQPENEDEAIRPAVDGTLRVLKAARDDTNVKRVVLTSSFAAIGYGKELDRPFNENDWTIIDATTTPYIKSKTLAEKAAWNFIEKECGDNSKLELTVINPVGVFGPVLGNDLSTSIVFIKSIIENAFPDGYPQFGFGVVDVRDVADIHYLAMIKKEAKGERFLATNNGFINLDYTAKILKEKVPELSNKIIIPLSSNISDPIVSVDAINDKAKSLLGWTPISTDNALISTAKSLIDLNLV
ncbi:hypothetical protein DICPUDRAFT_51509 [Dictyostelium purpureum]|uniref:NAD-dependent epimerase/dehydratase domain-containing protein n=1 Tax=Dictyostelium purpureum TaxID=5786 RepID=F1A438_DICPU|nr:uncharacterized protein DICPUDRAFT_51509 [Dictyostelium purpureum]EGC29048.1 hypothetical protein DICPUDRAFT_51509 [Dictyostelium purpureum]|eukprot:XP_003294432.1 hypothetical protein DICPUDRAFT_51509 [Dictyostelium purpureum]